MPLCYTRGNGARIEDVDGNVYLDFTLSQGPLILGHSPPEVLAAVAAASADGQLFAGQHLAEIELAERLVANIPCAELARFSLSGSEAVHAALRVARAATGRARFARFEGHYHGWLDNVAWSVAPPAGSPVGEPAPWTAGLPPSLADECVVLPWNDAAALGEALEAHGPSLAAVLCEPIACNCGCLEPLPGYLEAMRELCHRHGSVLIFDEVICGFRLGPGGAQARFGVTPDLAVFGKGLASGWPLSVLAGRRRLADGRPLMELVADGTVIHAGTMNSGQPSIAAALATLEVLARDDVPTRLTRLGERLMAGLRALAAARGLPLLAQGPGPMFHAGFTTLAEVRDYRGTLSYDKPRYARFVAAMQERGVRLIGRGLWYLSAAHTEADLDEALAAAAESFDEVAP